MSRIVLAAVLAAVLAFVSIASGAQSYIGGTVVAPVVTTGPRIVWAGDSVEAQGNLETAMNASQTFTCSGGNLVTQTGGGTSDLWGSPPINVVNLVNQAFAPATGNTGSTYISNTSFSYPLPGCSGSTTGQATYGYVLNLWDLTNVGAQEWVQSYFQGGIQNVANLGIPGACIQTAGTGCGVSNMATELSQVTALGSSAFDFVYSAGGVNDCKGSTAAASATISAMTTRVNAYLAIGGRVILPAVTPLRNDSPVGDNTCIQAVNAGYRALAVSNPTKIIYADIWSPLIIPATSTYAAPSYNPLYTGDGTHWNELGASIAANVIAQAIAPYVTTCSFLPTTNTTGQTCNFGGATYTLSKNYWNSGTTGGAAGTGCSGTIWNAIECVSSSASTTAVGATGSLRADGSYYQTFTVTPVTGATSNVTFYIGDATNVSLATLGLSTSNLVRLAVELNVSGASAAHLAASSVTAAIYPSPPSFGQAYTGAPGASVSANHDAYTLVAVTEPMQLNSNATGMQLTLRLDFANAATASAMTINIGHIAVWKK